MKYIFGLFLSSQLVFGFMTFTEDARAMTTLDLNTKFKLSQLHYRVYPANLSTEFTQTFEKILHASLFKKFDVSKVEKISKDKLLKIKVIYAESINKDFDLTKKENAQSFLEGSWEGVKSYIKDRPIFDNNISLENIIYSATLFPILAIIGQDNEYIAVIDLEIANKKTRLFLKTQRMYLSAEDAMRTLVQLSVKNIQKAIEGVK